MSPGGRPSTVQQVQNSMGHPVQGEHHEPSQGPVPETTLWDEFTPAEPEVTISLDASATV